MARVFANTNKKIRESVKLFQNVERIGIDTETSSLDPHTCKLWSIQFGDDKTQVMIPINGNPARFELKPVFELFMEEAIDAIFHRASFDLKVLWRNELDANSVYCTRTVEQILTAGKFADTSLAGVINRYGLTDGRISKVERKDFYQTVDGVEADANGMITAFENSGFDWTPELQNYALDDVKYLVPLAKAQIKELRRNGMINLASKIELPLTYVTALVEYRGVAMDSKACKKFQEEMADIAEEKRVELVKNLNVFWQAHARPIFKNNYNIYKTWADEHKVIVKDTNKDRNPENKKQLSEFAKQLRAEHETLRPFKTPPKEPKEININSTQQLRAAFAQDNVFLKDMRKETLQENTALHPLIEGIVEYRKFEKLSIMSEIYEKINKATGRIHASLNQNVDTGRYSCSNPSYHQIPVRTPEGKRFRSLFVAVKGCCFIVADYAAIELIIAGVKSKDTQLLYALNNVSDMHCYTMSKFLKCSYEYLVETKDGKTARPEIVQARVAFERKFNLPELQKCAWDVAGMSKWVNTFRDYVKTLTYGIAYGLSSFGLSRRFHCDDDTAQQFIDVFFSIYPKLKDYLTKQGNIGERNGFSTTVSGRRRYYNPPPFPTHKDSEREAEKYFKEQDRELDSVTQEEWVSALEMASKKLNKEYYSILNRIRRQAANHGIQGTSADITKYAMVLFEDWLADYAPHTNGQIDIRKHGIVLTVHDELVVEAPKKFAKLCAAKLKEFMEKAAHSLLGDNVKIEVKPKIVANWKDGK